MIRRFARPYAKAMMELAGSAEESRRMHSELLAFERARASNAQLANLYENPGVSSEQKLRVTREIAGRLGIDALSVRLLETLVHHHRVNDLEAVLEAWKAMINAALGIEVAEVRSAHELNESERSELKKALETKLGHQVELRVETDPALLGGFVAKIGSEVWDASVLGKISRFGEALA
ncbi:MAG: ATP synthase F1 subunit delta [Acidobacteria bacterium]|nr:ATP synthase F1 subunit delta [Acidobacteriota bacterium]